MTHKKLILILLLLVIQVEAVANSINLHLSGGPEWASFNKTDNIFLNSFVENSYNTQGSLRSSTFVSAGMSYQWDKLFSHAPNIAVGVGASGYFTRYNISGTNTPFINIGDDFDTLTYYARDNSSALFFEPKIIYTRFQWQPYLLGGLGVAWNRISSYSESPTNDELSAAPLPQPFGNMTTTNFAYEIGLGMQSLLYKTKTSGSLYLSLDYRYIDWGAMKLGTTPLQSTSRGPNLGQLQTQLVGIGLEYQLS